MEIAPPYGYRFKTDDQMDKSKVTGIEPEPEEAAVVKKIFTWVSEGQSLREIMCRLILDRVQPPYTVWSTAVLTRILRDEIYTGKL